MDVLRELLSRATADGSRTNALNHLHWVLAALIGVEAYLWKAGAPDSAIYFFGVVLAIVLIAYLVTHFYFMVNDPDALRSERFKIQKLAIQYRLIGDDRKLQELMPEELSNLKMTDHAGGAR